ncbi:MAG: diacylglycerol kinase family lipid kinase [Acidimicrobiia bacterium]|nr:diacylglycerol kinase family lipid kinase [Acidimicrobiia bacterium]
MTWLALVNPSSGRARDLESRARQALDSAGIDAEIEVSTSPEHLQELVDRGIASGVRDFIAVGGDGTTNLVVDQMMRHRWEEPPRLAILPSGSGSDFIRTFGLPHDLDAVAKRVATESPYLVDVGLLEWSGGDRYFLNVADIGIAAATVPLAERLPRRLGGLRYMAAFWMTLPRFRRAKILLVVGKRSFEGTALNVVVANGQFFGGGINVAPKAMLNDGAFDIQVFAVPKRRAFDLMPRVMRGTHLRHSGVKRFVGGAFSLETVPGWPVEADGEYVGTTPITGRIVRGALEVMI